jgi:hypothetical protein
LEHPPRHTLPFTAITTNQSDLTPIDESMTQIGMGLTQIGAPAEAHAPFYSCHHQPVSNGVDLTPIDENLTQIGMDLT